MNYAEYGKAPRGVWLVKLLDRARAWPADKRWTADEIEAAAGIPAGAANRALRQAVNRKLVQQVEPQRGSRPALWVLTDMGREVPDGFRPSQGESLILGALRRRPGMTPAELVQQVAVNRSFAQRSLLRMERAGVLRRTSEAVGVTRWGPV